MKFMKSLQKTLQNFYSLSVKLEIMKKDISTSEDVKTLVDAFYNDVKSDPIIGYVFTDVAKVDWEEHLPRMYKFWEFALLGNAIYKGNPMMKHIALNAKEPLTKEHFEQWIQLWEATIDRFYEGEIANRAKERGQLMKTVMHIKMEQINS